VPTQPVRIGARGSKLSLAQAGHMQRRIAAALGADPARPEEVERVAPLIVITTTGDRVQDRRLLEIGGKALFTKEIEEALIAGRIDCAIHSMKDVPAEQPPGLCIAAVPEREDVRDVLIAGDVKRIADLKRGAVVGTAALRRRAQLLHRRPDLQIVNFRGNVDTRLAKREAGVVDATLLALAGLKRLGLGHVGTPITEDEMLPAVGQGAVCIECRADDTNTRAWLSEIDHPATAVCVSAEHAMLAVLDGSCRTPIAGHAILDADGVHLRGLIAKPDGSKLIAVERRGLASDAPTLGRDAGEELKRRGGPDFFTA
jgi:hydroxymethylbilane synthase